MLRFWNCCVGLVIVPLLLVGDVNAGAVGVSFNRNTDEVFLPTVSAGAVSQINWNQTPPDNSGTVGGTLSSVVDDSGTVLAGLTVTYAANNTWAHNGANPSDGNISLLKGYLDDGGAGATVTVTGIPYSAYDVYVYGIGDQGQGGILADYTVSDGFRTLTPTWLRAANLNPGEQPIEGSPGVEGHYARLAGLTGSTLEITALNNAGAGRAPLAGIQIVESQPANTARHVVPIVGVTGHQQGDSATGNGSILTTINHAGLSAMVDPEDPSTWTHTNTWQTDWQGSFPGGQPANADQGWVVIDLGAPTDSLENLYLWNVNEGSALDRGTREFNLYYATSPTVMPPAVGGFQPYDFSSGGWTQLGGTLTLDQGTGSPWLPVSGVYNISGASGARYIGIDILSNYGSTWRVGLAEIAVTTVPEPSTCAMLLGLAGIGLLGCLRRRRRS